MKHIVFFNSVFQFHKGTIKTGLFAQDKTPETHFNSIKVQLRQPYEELNHDNHTYFNSIKVQLRPHHDKETLWKVHISIP